MQVQADMLTGIMGTHFVKKYPVPMSTVLRLDKDEIALVAAVGQSTTGVATGLVDAQSRKSLGNASPVFRHMVLALNRNSITRMS